MSVNIKIMTLTFSLQNCFSKTLYNPDLELHVYFKLIMEPANINGMRNQTQDVELQKLFDDLETVLFPVQEPSKAQQQYTYSNYTDSFSDISDAEEDTTTPIQSNISATQQHTQSIVPIPQRIRKPISVSISGSNCLVTFDDNTTHLYRHWASSPDQSQWLLRPTTGTQHLPYVLWTGIKEQAIVLSVVSDLSWLIRLLPSLQQ